MRSSLRVFQVLACGLAIVFAAAAQQPQIARGAETHRPLDGVWQFLPDIQEQFSAAALPATGWRQARVPLSIQAQFADLRDFKGAAWYRRTFLAPPTPPGGRVLLHFGAADYSASVWVNGRPVGSHQGGYSPFDCDVTPALRAGPNVLLVRVADPPGPPADFAASYAQIPHGKQNWYVQTSGLWQSVALETKPAAYLEWVHAATGGGWLHGFTLRIAHAGDLPRDGTAAVTVVAPDGAVTRRVLPLARQAEQTLPFSLDRAWLWSPAHPRLYRFSVALSNGDRLEDRFGLRTIAVRAGRIYLNGQPVFLRGALDQAFYPRSVYTPPSLDYLRREMRQARRLGLNLLRLHIKTPDPRYLQAADETGILLWYEIPNWDRLTEQSRARGHALLQAEIARDWNHPSLILQSIINESWGANLKRAEDRAWLLRTSEWARAHLPDRLVVDNSPCCGNFHLKTDLADFHNYNSIPDDQSQWDAWVSNFASRPQWLFSPYGDARPSGAEPLVVSEFGNWGLPILPARLPWWFSRAFNGNELTRPAGVFARLRAAGLARVFASYRDMALATEWHEWQALRHEIESMRLASAIQGYVITEFTDINWESNGLLNMWREPKVFAGPLAALQQPLVAIAHADRSDYRPGDVARVALWVSNESAAQLRGAQLLVAGERRLVPAVAPGAVVAAGSFSVPIRRRTTGYQVLRFELRSAGGEALDARRLKLAVVADAPVARAALELDPSLSPSLAAALRPRHATADSARILVTSVWNARAARVAGAGGDVLVLAGSATALPRGAGLRIVPRRGNLRGDWISNFNWLDTSRPPFAAFRALGPILGEPATALTPRWLISGGGAGGGRDVLGGFFLGWVHDAHDVVVQARDGRGRVLVVTLNLSEYGRDPLATAVLERLIGYIAGPTCKPAMQLIAEMKDHQHRKASAIEQDQVPSHQRVLTIRRRRRQAAP